MIVDHDTSTDVLYVRRPGTTSYRGREAPNDWGLILSVDASGDVVGATFIAAKEMATYWRTHPDRETVPSDIRQAIDDWYLMP